MIYLPNYCAMQLIMNYFCLYDNQIVFIILLFNEWQNNTSINYVVCTACPHVAWVQTILMGSAPVKQGVSRNSLPVLSENFGFFVKSCMPMRFAGINGTRINGYQTTIQTIGRTSSDCTLAMIDEFCTN